MFPLCSHQRTIWCLTGLAILPKVMDARVFCRTPNMAGVLLGVKRIS